MSSNSICIALAVIMLAGGLSVVSGNVAADDQLLPPLPAANAGPDQTVNAGNVVTFDGSASIASSDCLFEWTIYRPQPGQVVAILYGVEPTYTTNFVNSLDCLTATLTVTDAYGQSSSDSMNLKVRGCYATVNPGMHPSEFPQLYYTEDYYPNANMTVSIENHGLKSLIVTLHDINAEKPDYWQHWKNVGPTLKIEVSFTKSGSYPVGTVDLGPLFLIGDHTYCLSYKEIVGPSGSYADVFVSLDP